MINAGYSPMKESAEYLQTTMPISRSMFKELQSKFGGDLKKRGNVLDFNGDSDKLAAAIKYLRTTSHKDIPLIIVSNAYDTGYGTSPIRYNLGRGEAPLQK